MARGPYTGPANRAGRDPARNLNEWPPGLARRGPRPGEVGKAHGADRPHLRAPAPANSPPLPRRRPGARRAGPSGFSALPIVRCAAFARPGRWPARGGGAESGPGGRPCRARPASAGRLEHAVREDELPRNVARNVKTTTHQPRRFRPITAAEARQFLDAAHTDRLHALYELALRTGLRKGELLGLHWEELDLTTGTASVRRSLQRTRTGGLTHLPTKTRASERRIALPTECLRSLKKHQERQHKERETAGSAWTDSGLVFTTPTGRPLDPANLTRRFRSFLNRAGLRRIRFHDLRHSTATLLLEQGVDLVVIKELLGHAHIGVTAGVYAHVRLRLHRHAIDTLGTALSQGDDDPTTHPPQPSSADVAVSVCRQTHKAPSALRLRRGPSNANWVIQLIPVNQLNDSCLTSRSKKS
ncbi:tyrosine-type recombinase/integrase [Streptomyces sp. NPDC091292]|uniref:tyrosine-type recombinase/integrase n=1 Tax=Streptomyces sp. NPDC091292 TaxID=3365991 RepID=UPI003803611E